MTVRKAARPVSVSSIMRALPRQRQARIKSQAGEILAEELALHELRKAREITQEQLARRLGGQQVYVSRLEKRADLKLSTLRNYIRALGGELQLFVTFPKGTSFALKGIRGEHRPPTASGRAS